MVKYNDVIGAMSDTVWKTTSELGDIILSSENYVRNSIKLARIKENLISLIEKNLAVERERKESHNNTKNYGFVIKEYKLARQEIEKR